MTNAPKTESTVSLATHQEAMAIFRKLCDATKAQRNKAMDELAEISADLNVSREIISQLQTKISTLEQAAIAEAKNKE